MKRTFVPLLFVACGPGASLSKAPPTVLETASLNVVAVSADVLGPVPTGAKAPAFFPPTPRSSPLTNGVELRLLESHAVPLVSVVLALDVGATLDPVGKEGLSHFTAHMLAEGAGKLGGSELAAAFESLGTSLHIEVDADGAYFSFAVLKDNLAQAVALLADVIEHPQLSEKDFKRAHGLWVDALKARSDDADSVARVVMRKAVMGESAGGHPWSGTLAGAKGITRADVRHHYSDNYGSHSAHFAAAGDVSSIELTKILNAHFAKWKHALRASRPREAPTQVEKLPRLIIVDRPEAPQAVVGFARMGLAAVEPELPGVTRANIALGGSFTSRLNQDLREKHGWTYGARSAFSVSRGPGIMVAWAAVQTDATIDASKALLADIHEFAHKGLTEDEVSKTRATLNAEFVGSYSTVDAISARLAHHAILGEPLDADAALLQAATSLDGLALNVLTKKYFATDDGTFVIVGPLERFRARLSELDLGEPQLRDAEGQVIKPK